MANPWQLQARTSEQGLRGLPSLAGGEARLDCIYSSHQLQDSTPLGRRQKGIHHRGQGQEAPTYSCKLEGEAKLHDTEPIPKSQNLRAKCSF